MTDIHCHILPDVDDGGCKLSESLRLLKDMYANGVDKVVLTPHCYDGERKNTPELLVKNFNEFKAQVKNAGIETTLYLGEEIEFTNEFYRNSNEFLTLANGKALLLEFPSAQNSDVIDNVYNIAAMGFKPIVAHIERYGNLFNEESIKELKSAGGLVQINAGTILKKHGATAYKKCIKLIKKGLVDFIASDMHKFRISSLKEARDVIVKKCGIDAADALFYKNAEEIIFND